ncbi:MAG: CAP domain-containing protein [Patescibacteria group bacterium]|nr:CAP domain-containing protein [Patescibacteria group bacterium]
MNKMNKNLKNLDSDKDGLSDFDEINIYKTDPNNKDTDGDGIDDYTEIKLGMNPLIKDYFIPSKYNNYRPKALRPQRLFFYGLSVLIVKVIVILTALSMPLVAFFSPDYVTQESNKVIVYVNEIRAELGLMSLRANEKLMQSAMWKAEDMAVKGYFAHVNPENIKLLDWLKKSNYNFHFGGENLAMGFSTAEEAISAWKQSPSHYNNIIDPDFSETGVGISVGNYNNYETTFIAQHFASPKVKINNELDTEKDVVIESIKDIELTQELESAKPYVENVIDNRQNLSIIEKNDVNQISSTIDVLSAKEVNIEKDPIISKNDVSDNVSTTEDIIYDNIAPVIIDSENTKLLIKENINKEFVIMADIYLSDDTKNAELTLMDYKINLVQDDDNKTKWSGHLLVNDESIFDPVVSITLRAIDFSGNQLLTDIDWNSIIPIEKSISDEYSFVKSQKNTPINTLFNWSMNYYKFILILVTILLLVNIFVEIKKQRFDIIASAVFLILFIILLILY